MRSDQLPGQAVLTSAVVPDGMEWPFDTWLAMMHIPSPCTFLHGLLELWIMPDSTGHNYKYGPRYQISTVQCRLAVLVQPMLDSRLGLTQLA